MGGSSLKKACKQCLDEATRLGQSSLLYLYLYPYPLKLFPNLLKLPFYWALFAMDIKPSVGLSNYCPAFERPMIHSEERLDHMKHGLVALDGLIGACESALNFLTSMGVRIVSTRHRLSGAGGRPVTFLTGRGALHTEKVRRNFEFDLG